MSGKRYLVTILGPTASGKTAAAIAIAKHYGTVVVSADSRQLFREMTIGTAKPSTEELAAVPHYMVHHISVRDDYSAGKYADEVLPLLSELFQQHNVVVLAGGSGLYVNAVLEGFDELPAVKPGIREQLEETLETKGIEVLQQQLHELDPEYHAQVDLQNPHRLIRALEICLSSGKPFSSYRKGGQHQRDFEVIKIGLEWDREALYARINNRVDAMMQAGLLEEARALHPQRGLMALETVGYAELFDHFEGITDLDTAIELIKRNTRRYAKRQLTWWRKDADIQWFAPADEQGILDYLDGEIL